MLRKHGVHDADESLVTVEEAVAAGEQIALQPALAHVLGKHGVHDSAVGCEKLVVGETLAVEVAVRFLKNFAEPVRHGFVRAEDAEVAGLAVELEDVAHKSAELGHILRLYGTGRGHVNSVVAEVRHPQVAQQKSAVCVGICAHAVRALWGKIAQHLYRPAVFLKELLRAVAPEPLFQNGQMRGLVHHDRDLVRAEAALDHLAVHLFRAGPALRRAQDDHRPLYAAVVVVCAGFFADGEDFTDDFVHGLGHELVHGHRIVSLDKVGLPTAAFKEFLHFLV